VRDIPAERNPMNHLELYRQIQGRFQSDALLPRPERDDAALSNAERLKLNDRADKAESAERDAWAQYRTVEVDVRLALLDVEYLHSPQAEGRYTVLEGVRYAAEHKAATASGRAREARRQEMAAAHAKDCHEAARAFYESPPAAALPYNRAEWEYPLAWLPGAVVIKNAWLCR
jgi:hypothetical protein